MSISTLAPIILFCYNRLEYLQDQNRIDMLLTRKKD